MKQKKITTLSEIKTLDDLRLLKLEKRYHLELKRMEFRFHLLQLAEVVNPENIKNEIISEGKNFLLKTISGYAPPFLWKLFSK